MATYQTRSRARWSLCRGMLLVIANIFALLSPDAMAQCQPFEFATLVSPRPTIAEGFGYSSSIDGDTLVVGDPSDSDHGVGAGAVYVFRAPSNDPHTWTFTAKLYSSDSHPGQFFGSFVASKGDVLVVGSPFDSSLGIQEAGAVYVFERDNSGANDWRESAKLTASNPTFSAQFGSVAAIHRNTVVVGAPHAEPVNSQCGAVYIFESILSGPSRSWHQVQQLAPPVQKDGLRYGITLDIANGRIATGAFSDDAAAIQAGAIYVYSKAAGFWALDGLLTAPDAAINDRLHTVTLSGNQVIAGALGDDDQGSSSGSVYVFSKHSNGWQFDQKVLPIDGHAGDGFGTSLASDEDLLLITAPHSSALAAFSGAVYVFRRTSNGAWLQSGVLSLSDVQDQDSMKFVSLSSGVSVVGVQRLLQPGAVHMFDTRVMRTSTTYCRPSTLSLPDCVPSIATTGNATASASSEFLIRSGSVPGGHLGFFFFSTSTHSLPISAFADICLPTSTISRSPLLFSNGDYGVCNGELEIDWTEIVAAQVGQIPSLGVPGTHVYGQFAFFSFGSSSPLAFTDAVVFMTCP